MEQNEFPVSSCSQESAVSQQWTVTTTSLRNSCQISGSDVCNKNPIENVIPMTFPQSKSFHFPCLPVSKGSIKKPAETRFVNSSPRSYRLMPASVESSDTTSFVEKSSHPNHTPMKVMLEVAELWKLSKRSELECNFTLAKSNELLLDTDHYIEEATKRSPICHPIILPNHVHKQRKGRKRDNSEHSTNTASGRRLFAFVKIFFGAKELDTRDPIGAAETLKQQLDNGVILTMNFLKEMQVHSAKSNWMTIDKTKSENFSLAPLVKRLSVSGHSEEEEVEKQKVEYNRNFCEKPQTSTKRPNSSSDIDYDEAPVNKRALSNSALLERSIHPG